MTLLTWETVRSVSNLTSLRESLEGFLRELSQESDLPDVVGVLAAVEREIARIGVSDA